ncbi:MAG: acyltransferase, partial [Anaerolineales bacterium]|nr:acyltransferase [Anaerolineales bacterium]
LDGLRAVAFLLVFAYHAKYLGVGWVGVQFFFVLSGFLITGILLDMKKSLPAGGYFLRFYGRRFLRIIPLYYFYLLLMGVVAAWLISISYRTDYMEAPGGQMRYAILYVYNFLLATTDRDPAFYLEHLWTLSIEEQFYVFWPLLIFLVPERFQKRLFLAFIVLGLVFRIAFYFVHAFGEFRNFHPNVSEALYPLPFTHIDAFAFGAYISRHRIPKARGQFFILLGLVPLIGFASQYLSTAQFGPFSTFGYALPMSAGYKFIWGYSLLNYFFAVTIQAVAMEGMFNRFLEWSPMRYLGKISYGLYVYHQPITWFAFDIRDLAFFENVDTQPISALLAFLATLLIATASYHLMEKPILDLKDRFFPIKRALPPGDLHNGPSPN